MQRTTAVLAAVVAIVLAYGYPAGASSSPPRNQCVVHVVGHRATGQLVLSERHCYTSFLGAMRAEGVDAWGSGAASKAKVVALSTFTLATHYDGANRTGASTSVVGSDCGGGWLNTSATWSNRISYTQNGCPRVRHYDGANLTGASESTFSPGGNLVALNNKTNSIQYLT
jgi:hypothetical protein